MLSMTSGCATQTATGSSLLYATVQVVSHAHSCAAMSQALFPDEVSRSVAVTLHSLSMRMPSVSAHRKPVLFSTDGTCRTTSSDLHEVLHRGGTVYGVNV